MEALILSHSSAIRAIRHERRVHGALRWERLGKVEQRKALAAAVAGARSVDFDDLSRHGVWGSAVDDELHLLVASAGARARRARGMVSHVCSGGLPAQALMRVSPGLYCVAPAYAVLQCSYDQGFEVAFSLLMEMLGMYSLPEELTMPVLWGGVWPDRIARESVEQAHYWCDPALSPRELAAMARGATGSAARSFRMAARYAKPGSASPGETLMFGMFGLPMGSGGFAVDGLPDGGMLLNHRLNFGSLASRMSSGKAYAVCDAYVPAAKTDMEYNGLGHEQEATRIKDGQRNNGLRGEGVRVLVINRNQMRDIVALEAMAQSIYKDAGVRFRYRVPGYRERQRRLLNGLRAAIGLPPA